MIRNYLKIAVRNMQKNALHTFFNVLGLAMGIACCITVYIFVDTMLNMDTAHREAERIFTINHVRLINNREEFWGLSKGPLGPAIKNDFPEVTDFIRLDDNNAVVKRGDLIFNEDIRFADANFFSMFTFSLASGVGSDLAQKNAIFLSEEKALKYFGDQNPVGQTLTLIFEGEKRLEFVVKGVAKKFPRNTSFAFNFLVNYENIKDIYPQADRWTYNVSATFIKLHRPEDVFKVEQGLSRYLALQNESNPNQPAQRFYLDNLLTMSKNSWQVRGDISGGTNPHGIYTLTFIAALVMLMACFNYINIAVASAARRFKEIGIRKVVGGTRGQLVKQFLTENFITTLTALGLGVVFAETLTIPFFNSIIQGNTVLAFDISADLRVVIFLAVLTSSIGLLAGLYPSLYMSSFKPVNILKDVQKIDGNRWLGKTLLVLQFSISLFAVIAGIIFTQNAEYIKTLDYGYEDDQIVALYFKQSAQFHQFEQKIRQDSRIHAIAGSAHHAGRNIMGNVVYESNGAPSQANVMRVGSDYIQTLALRMKQGRAFDRAMTTDAENSAIVNATLVKAQGWTEPIGQRLKMNDKELTVVGVVEDFFYRSYHRAIDPCILTMIPDDEYRYMSIKVAPEHVLSIRPLLESTWREIMPDEPFDMIYQNEIFLEDLTEDEQVKNVFLYVAIMTLMIAAMGLFALVSLSIAKRTKEIGIRKVLGASVAHVIHLVNRDFYWLIGIASVIIFPIAFFLLTNLLNSIYAVHVDITALPFILSVLIFGLVAIITIGMRVYGVAKENPVHALKYE
ncbi:MAG TPA: ABC transporter permease [bacterium]|nr:ABC transporter permease [bacterium]